MRESDFMRLALLLILLVANTSFAEQSNKDIARKMYLEVKKEFKDVPEVTLSKAKELNKKNEIVFIDVRKKKEREISTIPGAIGTEEFEKNRSKYEDKVIAVYCTIGYRSAKYIKKLKKKKVRAYNLEGSILGWVHDSRPVVNKKGKAVKTVHVYGRSWNHLPEDYKGVW